MDLKGGMTMDNLPYKVWDRFGKLVLQATADNRYSKEAELGLLKAGYTIKLGDKKITKKEIKK